MKVAYVRWLDAAAVEAGPEVPVDPTLAELHEVAFLISENDEVVTIGMEEVSDPTTVTPGRWRLNIPKSQIKEFHIKELGKIFPLRKKEKAKKAEAQK